MTLLEILSPEAIVVDLQGETKEEIIAIEREMEDLKQELETALQDVRAKWDEVAQQKGEYEVTPALTLVEVSRQATREFVGRSW